MKLAGVEKLNGLTFPMIMNQKGRCCNPKWRIGHDKLDVGVASDSNARAGENLDGSPPVVVDVP
jgi:hypothetical protein